MAQISVAVQNDTPSNWSFHVYDLFANGRREVSINPFALAPGETSPPFAVNAEDDGTGAKIAWQADGGPSKSNIDVADGETVSMD